MIGQCKLCLQHGIELQNSHYMPKGIYKILREDWKQNPNPASLSVEGVVKTSRQAKAHLLCSSCEKLFNSNGEDWVLSNCLKNNGRFPIGEILKARNPDIPSDGSVSKVYHASGITGIDISALTYFAASIFWRGSVHPWNRDLTVPVRLGPFQESFRQYLLGASEFPVHASLCVTARDENELKLLTLWPTGEKLGTCHVWKFTIPGLAFSIVVGRNIPAIYRKLCFYRAPGNPIVLTPILENSFLSLAQRLLAATGRTNFDGF